MWVYLPSEASIRAHYPWAMGLLLGDVHLSELERLDKPCATVVCELAIIRFTVNDISHSAISSHHHHYNNNLGQYDQ